jgi:hypothetical protein
MDLFINGTSLVSELVQFGSNLIDRLIGDEWMHTQGE